jgi:hypothetical protein
VTLLYRICPPRQNIGNTVIGAAVSNLIRGAFGEDASIVEIPALAGPDGIGGITARQAFDLNRAADGVLVGGGNLFENGQLTIEPRALDALHVPMLLIGLSHGLIHDRDESLGRRTDAMPDHKILQLAERALLTLVRDHGTADVLRRLGAPRVEVGGCPTLFLDADRNGLVSDGRILLSIRHPARMSVPLQLQWRVTEDVRRLIVMLGEEYGGAVHLVCHDYVDVEFARGFPEVPLLYFEDVPRYLEALRRCRLSVTYRLHAFLPCLAFGTPSIHLTYDSRGRDAVATAGMAGWDVDLLGEPDVVEAVQERLADLDRYHELRAQAAADIGRLRTTTTAALERFADTVRSRPGGSPREATMSL